MFFTPPPVTVPITPSALVATTSIPSVPFYSQFRDITYPAWQKVGCGIASLAMIVDYYEAAVPADTLLGQATSSGAYLPSAGWTYQGLIGVAQKHNLDGSSYDLASVSAQTAFTQLTHYLQGGPVIVSVHYKFDPKSTIPHLVVINGITNGLVYYNDPAAKVGEKTISTADFLKAWKKRFIVLRPTKGNT